MSFVHKITSVAITLAMLASLTACGGNNDTPATTTATADTTTVGQGLAPAETTDIATTAPVEEVFDVDTFLSDCTVYEVTTDTATDPLNVLDKMSEADKPEKIALRFTDAEGLTVLAELADETELGYQYSIKRAITENVEVVFKSGFVYYGHSFFVQKTDDTIIIQDSTLGGKKNCTEYHIIKGNEYHSVLNRFNEDGYVLSLHTSNGEVTYSKDSIQYYYAKQSFPSLADAYVSEDDFYSEYGTVNFENGKIKYTVETASTIGDLLSGETVYKEYAKRFKVNTFGDLVGIYKQYKAENRENEFWEYVEYEKE